MKNLQWFGFISQSLHCQPTLTVPIYLRHILGLEEGRQTFNYIKYQWRIFKFKIFGSLNHWWLSPTKFVPRLVFDKTEAVNKRILLKVSSIPTPAEIMLWNTFWRDLSEKFKQLLISRDISVILQRLNDFDSRRNSLLSVIFPLLARGKSLILFSSFKTLLNKNGHFTLRSAKK